MIWTAFWVTAIVRANRILKHNLERVASRRPLPKWLSIPLKALFVFWIFGWALFVGLAWGFVAGVSSFYLELFAAVATVLLSDLTFAFCERHGTSSLMSALLTQLRWSSG